MTERAEEYRYYSASAGDLSKLTVQQLTFRIGNFDKIHKQEMKFRFILAGGKPK